MFIGGNLYEKIGGNALGSLGLSNKWLEEPLPMIDHNVSLGGSGNPLSELKLLMQEGALVKSLGARMIGGISTHGFSVDPHTAEMRASIKKELAKASISPQQRQEIQAVEKSPPDIKFDLWFGSSGLLKEMNEKLSTGLGGTSNDQGNITLIFSDYGVPVSISPTFRRRREPFSNHELSLELRSERSQLSHLLLDLSRTWAHL
jgi:hypothetical protein